ncbi:MAG: hypothetical protein QOG73_3824 [Acetobacteraceae bacterium]|jgi:hypothetical protein|nr:hypothetical protein [Acetobacteraceae bacterium]
MPPVTPVPQNHDPAPVPCPGFVVAMRAKLIGASNPARHEWIIVSRWGPYGEYLSIAWTSRPAHLGTAPISLAPRQAALAVRQERPAVLTPATFTLTSSLPEDISLAGDFVPAKGFVRLSGNGTRLRMHSEGQSLKPSLRSAWHVEATRARWIGEFFEATAAAANSIAGPALLAARAGSSG